MNSLLNTWYPQSTIGYRKQELQGKGRRQPHSDHKPRGEEGDLSCPSPCHHQRATSSDERYEGVASLFQAEVSKRSRSTGMLRFAFPALLIPILKDPGHFARLRVHFLIGLSGKYSVTLYELLESVANKIDPFIDVQLDTLRQWLKVPEGKLNSWDYLNSRALLPAY